MAAWVSQYSTELRLASYILGAIALVFSGKVLGRIPALAKKGGLYSSVLVALPAAILLGVVAYTGDVFSNHFFTNSINSAFMVSLDPIQYAIVLGILSGALPALAAPRSLRWFEAQRRAQERIRMEYFPTPGEILEIGLAEFISFTLAYAIAAQCVVPQRR